MERILNEARKHLLWCSERLAQHRRIGQLNSNDHDLLQLAEENFLDALDRVWAVQCMANASLV